MTDPLTNEIGTINVTDADDYSLARALNAALGAMDADRQEHAYTSIRYASTEDRLAACEAAILALATVVSRRLGL